MNPSVLFTSWHGRYYSDSPRAISEELWRRRAPLEHVWVVGEQTGPVPEWVTTVPRGSAAHRAALESARYIVANDVVHDRFEKAPGTVYLQTWHGTPLKRIALDVARPAFSDADTYPAELAHDVARWDVLLSPNRFSTDVLRGALGYRGEVLETGYPRNDLLLSPERDAIRAAVRERLGLPPETRAVLYMPTWRDDREFTLELDVERAAAALAPDDVLLVRAHWLAGAAGEIRRGTVRDVTAFQDVRELYLAADVLVTDYSSAMFDFAVTGRPMLFYTYDLDHYRDVLRGFYWDFEREAPGPLLHTTSEVVDALRDLDAVVARHRAAYQAFTERFCHLDDGRASARVVEAVFGADAGEADPPWETSAPAHEPA